MQDAFTTDLAVVPPLWAAPSGQAVGALVMLVTGDAALAARMAADLQSSAYRVTLTGQWAPRTAGGAIRTPGRDSARRRPGRRARRPRRVPASEERPRAGVHSRGAGGVSCLHRRSHGRFRAGGGRLPDQAGADHRDAAPGAVDTDAPDHRPAAAAPGRRRPADLRRVRRGGARGAAPRDRGPGRRARVACADVRHGRAVRRRPAAEGPARPLHRHPARGADAGRHGGRGVATHRRRARHRARGRPRHGVRRVSPPRGSPPSASSSRCWHRRSRRCPPPRSRASRWSSTARPPAPMPRPGAPPC